MKHVVLPVGFREVLQGMKSELFAVSSKLPLPRCEAKREVGTPYLRRRMHGRLRGHCG